MKKFFAVFLMVSMASMETMEAIESMETIETMETIKPMASMETMGFYIYNTYYGKVLSSNAEGNGPAIVDWSAEVDSTYYIYSTEQAGSGYEEYIFLQHMATGKYLQASNAWYSWGMDTWSVWFAGDLQQKPESYMWSISELGSQGAGSGEQVVGGRGIISRRGESVNGSSKCYLGVDPDHEADEYVNVYYDKELNERSQWQLIPVGQGFLAGRLQLYIDAIDEAIEQGEAVYDNPMFGTHEEQYELAVALYNARSAREPCSQGEQVAGSKEQVEGLIETLETARKALLAAISNAQEGKYTIWISGNSFEMGEQFTLSIRNLKGLTSNPSSQGEGDNKAVMFVIRNSKRTGVTYTIREDGDWWLKFDGENVSIYHDGELRETVAQTTVATTTSAGTSAEWTVFGEDNLTACVPEIISSRSALDPGQYEENDHGKAEVTALMVKGTGVDLDFAVDYHVLSSTATDADAITLSDEDAWVIFDNIRPSDVKGYSNYRKAIYLHGCAVYQPSAVAMYGYGKQLYDGEEYEFRKGKSTSGEWVNELQSLVLKRGYMVCLATQTDGGGYSRVYVADHEDKRIDALPELLRHRISYVYIRPWNWVSKKGWCSTEGQSALNTEGKLVGATWFYTWSADKSTQADMEYVPHKSHVYWPGWSSFDKENCTAVLGYNEPEHSEQHSDDCGTTIGAWTATTHTPEFQACGLRIGSPSPTDASWLKEYIGHCNDMAYRCDFVSFHAYWGTNEAANASSWKSQLQSIYNNTKRPIWLTEWNNGASWTTESWPSSSSDKYTRQKNAIKEILAVLDGCDFIERYSIYNWDSWFRACMSWDSDKNSWWVTPCGEVYRDDHPSHAYKESVQFIPVGWFPSVKKDNKFSFTLKTVGPKINTVITDKNGDFTEEEELQYLTPDGEWKHFYTIEGRQRFDTTSERTENYSLKDCNPDAFQTDSLTLRLRITTLKGDVVYTESCTQYVSNTIRVIVGVEAAPQQGGGERCSQVAGSREQVYDLAGRRISGNSGQSGQSGKTGYSGISGSSGLYIQDGRKTWRK